MANILKSFWENGFGFRRNKFDLPQPDEEGMFPLTTLWSLSPQFNDYTGDARKINAILECPAMMKVVSIQCDLFSLGKIKVMQNDKEVIDDPFTKLLAQPNPFQTQSQFLWDMMFWNMTGNCYCYVDSNIIDNTANKLYFLENRKIQWPPEMYRYKDKMVFSKAMENTVNKISIKYMYEDGTTLDIPLSKIICIPDLTNGTGNWFKGASRIDTLYKVISNSEAALDSQNINIRFAGKYLVAGQADPKNISQIPLSTPEATDIERKASGRKHVHAVKSMVDIKRFVEDMRKLELGKSFLEAYYIIGSMFNIPKDVLEAYNSSTYENQEKARAAHVSYTLQPKGDNFLQALGNRFGYPEQKKKIVISWDYLPFMQVFEMDRVKVNQIIINTMANMLNQGVSLDEINLFLGTNFKTGHAIDPANVTERLN